MSYGTCAVAPPLSDRQPINALRAAVGRALQRALPLAAIPALGMNGAGTQCCRVVAAERYCSPGRGRDGTDHGGGRAGRGGAGRGAGRRAACIRAVLFATARFCSSLPFRPPPLRPTGCGLGEGLRPEGPRAPPVPPRPPQIVNGPNGAGLGRENLTEVLMMRELLWDPDASSGREEKATWRCPPSQQHSERCGAFPSLSYARGGRRGGRPRVKRKRLPFSPKSQSGECPCCRKPGKSLAEQPRFLKARYSSTFHPVVRSNKRAEDGLQGRENQSEASGQLDSKWGEMLMPG
ncbi:uncharacterized protein [Phaenicophaeus curvirostris]|uniref:uncharacterized protein n=1 Tax=Phaenicophaeus curvirostris TaxID=33595 RepID=UPI0037F0AC2E